MIPDMAINVFSNASHTLFILGYFAESHRVDKTNESTLFPSQNDDTSYLYTLRCWSVEGQFGSKPKVKLSSFPGPSGSDGFPSAARNAIRDRRGEFKENWIRGWCAYVKVRPVACVINDKINRSYGNVVNMQSPSL